MRYPVTLEVKEIRGTCPLHQVDDQVTIFNGCLEGKVCLPTLSRYIELLSGLCFGMPAADEATLACPDNGNVIFQLRRDSTRYWKDALSPLAEVPENYRQQLSAIWEALGADLSLPEE